MWSKTKVFTNIFEQKKENIFVQHLSLYLSLGSVTLRYCQGYCNFSIIPLDLFRYCSYRCHEKRICKKQKWLSQLSYTDQVSGTNRNNVFVKNRSG